jgi:sulfate transport system permease protein
MGRPLIHRSPMPGLGLSMGITLTMLSLVVLLPIGALLLKGANFGLAGIWETVNRERVWAALFLSFRLSLFAALFNLVFGVLLAWVLVRYRFPGRRILDAAVDLPFALPTAVAGISLTALYAPNGAFGQLAAEIGWKIAYTQWGIFIALVFVGLPFVTRTVQPVIEEIEREVEEASATLGASRLHTIRHVILPMLTPAALTGFALALARAVGEYGSVIFIAGNRSPPHHHPARGIQLRRRRRHWHRHAADQLCDAAGHQPHPSLEPSEDRICLTPPHPASAPRPKKPRPPAGR